MEWPRSRAHSTTDASTMSRIPLAPRSWPAARAPVVEGHDLDLGRAQ